jgi:hypothetical protein
MAIADIKDAIANAGEGTPDFARILNDVNDATTEWNALTAGAGPMVLNITVNTAELSPGMSQDEIQAATSAAQNVDLIQFVNGTYAKAA